MTKIEILLSIIAITSLTMTFILYKNQNKNGQEIKYIEINNEKLK